MNTILQEVKKALRIAQTNAFDDEVTNLINACLLDLQMVGIVNHVDTTSLNPYTLDVVKIYCKMNFGDVPPEEYDRLKASYDEKKAQLQMSTGFTVWL
jgi:hypothetical protein